MALVPLAITAASSADGQRNGFGGDSCSRELPCPGAADLMSCGAEQAKPCAGGLDQPWAAVGGR